jgi:hypothetical protein
LQPANKQIVSQFKYATGGQESTYDKAKQAAAQTYEAVKHKAEDLVSSLKQTFVNFIP